MKEEGAGESQEAKLDVRSRVMTRIKRKKVKMRCHAIFLAEKLGFESALLASMLVGALFLSLIFYLFKKAGLIKFFSLGTPGLKVLLYSLPYGYFTLFIVAGILVVYFSKKLDIPCQKNISCDRIFVYFLGLGFFLGIIFFLLGMHRIFGELARRDLVPPDMATHGKIKRISPNGIIIEDEDGRMTNLIFDADDLSPEKRNYVEGKFMRAVGNRDNGEEGYFHARAVSCCDDD